MPAGRSVARSERRWWLRRKFPNESALGPPGVWEGILPALFYYVFQSSMGQLTIITSDAPRPRSDWRVEIRAERRARRGAAQSRIRRSGPAGGGENNGGQRVV